MTGSSLTQTKLAQAKLVRATTRPLESRVAAIVNIAVDFASRSMHWPRLVKRLAVAASDALLGLAAVWIAFSLRLGEWHGPDAAMFVFAIAMLGLWYPVAMLRGVYRTIFRFSGRGAIIALMVCVGLASLPLIGAFMVIQQPDIPRTVAILGPLVFFLLMSLSRIVGRYILVDLFTTRAGDPGMKRVVIYGAGATGQRLSAALAAEAGMRVVGYVDDDPGKAGHFLDGIRVEHSSQIAQLVERRRVTDIVIAITNVGFARRKAIIKALEPLSLNVQTLPPMRHLMEGRINAAALRPIAVEDLLGRPTVPEHGDLLSRAVAGKVVMVTGAGGSIGSEICRQILAQRPAALVLVEANEFALFSISNELEAALAAMDAEDGAGGERPLIYSRLADISRAGAVTRLFAEFAPHTIYHAAAYKHAQGRRDCGRAGRGSDALPRDGGLGQPRQAQQRLAGLARLSRDREVGAGGERLVLLALRGAGAQQIPAILILPTWPAAFA